MKDQTPKGLSEDIAKLVVGAKAVGYAVKQLPTSISQRREAKRNGETPNGLFDYLEDLDFDWDEEVLETTEKTDRVLKKMEEIVKKSSPINIIKNIYERIRSVIKNKETKSLPAGRGEEIISEEDKTETFDDKRKTMLKELTKDAPSMEEQKKASDERNSVSKENSPIKNQEAEKEIDD